MDYLTIAECFFCSKSADEYELINMHENLMVLPTDENEEDEVVEPIEFEKLIFEVFQMKVRFMSINESRCHIYAINLYFSLV